MDRTRDLLEFVRSLMLSPDRQPFRDRLRLHRIEGYLIRRLTRATDGPR